LQPIVKKGAASKRCGCDPPAPEVAGLTPLPLLMDMFRRMCVAVTMVMVMMTAMTCDDAAGA